MPLEPPADLPNATDLARQFRRRRRKTLVTQWVAGVVFVITAVILTSMVPTIPRTLPVPQPPEAPSPAIAEASQWAERARLAVVTLQQQLDQASSTATAWDRQPGRLRYPTPDAVYQLTSQRQVLAQQLATLHSELGTYEMLLAVRAESARTRHTLAELDRTLGPRELDVQGADAQRQLRLERNQVLAQQRRQHEEFDLLTANVRDAAAAPFPAPTSAAETQALVGIVRGFIDHPERPRPVSPRQLDAPAARPKAIEPRHPEGPTRQDVHHGAPPNPGRALPECDVSEPPALSGPGMGGGETRDRRTAAQGPQPGPAHTNSAPSVEHPQHRHSATASQHHPGKRSHAHHPRQAGAHHESHKGSTIRQSPKHQHRHQVHGHSPQAHQQPLKPQAGITRSAEVPKPASGHLNGSPDLGCDPTPSLNPGGD